jgi:hypothetical protein
MRDKIPKKVVLEMALETGNGYCANCYFFKNIEKCPKDWSIKADGLVLSCSNNRDIYFKEIGEEK